MRRRLLAATTAIAVLGAALVLTAGLAAGTAGKPGCTGAKFGAVWCQPIA